MNEEYICFFAMQLTESLPLEGKVANVAVRRVTDEV